MRVGLLSLTAIAAVGVTSVFVPPQEVEADTVYIQQPLVLSERDYPEDTMTLQDEFETEEIMCLAKNIYFEAGNQPTVGKYAVTHVVLNRVESLQYPDTVCGVVEQAELSQWHLDNTGKEVPVRNRCQFSWFCDGQPDDPIDGTQWEQSVYIATTMFNEYINNEERLDITEGSMYYHATYVKPFWAPHMTKVARIGDHIFYRN